jgi:hypothetical protein
LAQLNWTYTSDRGLRYKIGMYHGPESGHFMVYCNSKIILIDFHVRKSQTYSFFIENELLEIKIKEDEKEGYAYDFILNTEADTPANKERQKLNNKHFTWALLGLALFCIVVFSGYKIMDARNDRYLEANRSTLLEEKGLLTTARLSVDPQEGQNMKVSYAFISNGKARQYEQDISMTSLGLLPVRSGDQFKITYLPNHPDIHELHLEQPHRKTLERFSELVLNKLIALHPQLNEQEAQCLIQAGMDAKGTAGLADLFYQDLTAEEHPEHNYDTFQRLVASEGFRKAIVEHCGGVNAGF